MIAMLQAAGAVPTSAKDLILNAGIETKIVLGILIVLSLVSWAIMFGVGRELSKSLRLADSVRARGGARAAASRRRAKRRSMRRRTRRSACWCARCSSSARVRAMRGDEVLTRKSRAPSHRRRAASRVETLRLVLDAEALVGARPARALPSLARDDRLGEPAHRPARHRARRDQRVRRHRDARIGQSRRGRAGRREALVATAAALSVAIPATFGYNILANRLNRLDNLLEGFGTTLIAMLVREGRI